MPAKCLLLILDGLGDRGHPELNGLTPLQAARAPALDALAKAGACGLFHAARPGLALPSELAHFLLFGYPESAFPGRGALEALGWDFPLAEGEVAVMARLVSVAEEQGRLRLVKDTPELESPAEAEELAACLPDMETRGLRLSYNHCRGLSGLLFLRPGLGHAPSPFVTDTNPIRDGAWLIEPRPLAEHGEDESARVGAAAVKDYLLRARELLRGHRINIRREARGLLPINALATQRAGRLRPMTPFARRYGLRGACVASGQVYRGLAKYVGLEHIRVRDSGDLGRDLAERLKLALGVLKNHDFIHVHTKAPDEAAHSGDCRRKRDVIEALDAGVASVLPELLADPELLVVVTADHSTPSSGALIHSGEPVPLVMHGQGLRRDGVDRFDEVAAAGGCLSLLRGPELMYTILNHLDRARLLGLRDCPEPFEEFPAWPGNYEPFSLVRERP